MKEKGKGEMKAQMKIYIKELIAEKNSALDIMEGQTEHNLKYLSLYIK